MLLDGQMAKLPSAPLTLCLRWEPSVEGQPIDLDALVVGLNATGKVSAETDLVFYNNLTNADKSMTHRSDNVVGDDNEQICLDLARLSPDIVRLDLLVNSYSGQRLTDLARLTVRVVNDADHTDLVTFTIDEFWRGSKSGLLARIERHDGGWRFVADAQSVDGFNPLIESYGIEISEEWV